MTLKHSSHMVLTVEADSNFQYLVKSILESYDGIKVAEASSPLEAKNLIKKNNIFPVIWSAHHFKSDKTGGMDFLRSCRKTSPLSSRVLCSGSLEAGQLKTMVKVGDIHSYYSTELFPDIVGNILSSIEIGVEYHKVNICGTFFDMTSSILNGNLDVNLAKIESVINELKDEPEWKYKDRELEKQLLLFHTKRILEKAQVWVSDQNILLDRKRSEESNKKVVETLGNAQDMIVNLYSHLNQSKLLLQKSVEKSQSVSIKTTEMDKKLQNLKSEL